MGDSRRAFSRQSELRKSVLMECNALATFSHLPSFTMTDFLDNAETDRHLIESTPVVSSRPLQSFLLGFGYPEKKRTLRLSHHDFPCPFPFPPFMTSAFNVSPFGGSTRTTKLKLMRRRMTKQRKFCFARLQDLTCERFIAAGGAFLLRSSFGSPSCRCCHS